MVKQLSDNAPFAMIGFEFAMAIAIALFLISSASGNFQILPAVLAAAIMSLLCLPLLAMLYWSADDPLLKKTFLGLIVYFIIQTISGVIWYLLSMMINDHVFDSLAMLLMVIGYVPLLITLHATINIQRLKARDDFRHLLVTTGAVTVIGLIALITVRLFTGAGNAYPAAIYTCSVIADVLIIAMCTVLIIRNFHNGRRVIFSILLATFLLSLSGDILNLASVLGVVDGANLAQCLYEVMLTLIMMALLLYSMTTVNVMLLNRVNRELYDTKRLVGDILLYTPDAICITGPDGDMISANRQFEELIGMRQAADGCRFNVFNDCSLLGDETCARIDELRQGRAVVSRGVKIRGNGSADDRYYSVKMFPAISSVGETAKYVIITEDITALMTAEEALKRSKDELELRVQERTRELKEANSQLAQANARKDVLLKEVHHRVKNNLQIISSLFSIQAYSIQDETCRSVLRESQDRIRSIALIHEKLCQAPDIVVVDFSRYILSLVDNLYRSYGADRARIGMSVTVENANFDIDTAIPCGLIINELVSNALKYAFPDGRKGEITISVRREDDRYMLEVRDNGIGLPEGMDVHNVTSMGLQLVDVLVGQLGGNLMIRRANGTCFSISFPVRKKRAGIDKA